MRISNLLTDTECVNPMTADKVHWFLDLFDELGIKVWIDGGWGVDALLGECTREHQDLDIIISWEDSAILTEALSARGFVDIYTDDRKDRNFVMGHRLHGKIDFHVIELTEGGGAVYGPGEIDWVITESELDAVGTIGGRQVRCLSVDYQVRSHSGYTLQDTDFADLRALHEKYGVKLLPTQIKEAS
ncbi:MAG: amino acid transporter [Candidatus Poribacteria bacterium]|nr:amino acid transporter [Candidatus Poribacteria bacterium]